MKDSIDFKRFLINFTKLLALIMIIATNAFIVLTLNEQISMANKNGQGAFLFKSLSFPALPR